MDEKTRGYLRFGAMIATSMVVMFILMYFNTYAFEHVRWSETRFYMTFIMGGAMVIVMLGFMWGMYQSRKINIAIMATGFLMIAVALGLVRSQMTVSDRSYMDAMIPHHSIAILTSERARIEDVRVRELADGIIRAQRKEIKEMEWLVKDIAENGPVTTQQQAEARPVPDFKGELDPETPAGSQVAEVDGG